MTTKALVMVYWKDARSEDGWSEQAELDMRVAEITTLGHLIHETDDVLCVASSVDDRTGQVSGVMFIPKVCIVVRKGLAAARSPGRVGKVDRA